LAFLPTIIMKTDLKVHNKVSFLGLYRFAGPCTLLTALLGMCCGVLTGFLWPVLFYKIGDAYTAMQNPYAGAGQFYENTCFVSRWMLGLGTVALVAGYVGVLCSNSAARQVTDEVRRRYLQSLLRQNLRWVDKHNPLTLPSQMHTDCAKLESAIGEKLLSFCSVAAFLVVGAVNCVLNCPQLAAVTLFLSPLVCIGMVLVGYTMTRREALKHQSYSSAGSIAEESITDYKTVAAHCAENSRIEAYTQHLDSPNQVAARLSLIFGLGWGVILCMWFVITSLLFWYGGVLISDGAQGWIKGNKIGVSEEIVVFLTIGTSFLYVGNLVPCYQAIVEGRTAAYRAYKLIDKKHFLPNGTAKPIVRGRIQFDNVYFQYSVGKGVPALCGLSFEALAGQVTALVGESGAGKSTVAQLVERFYDPLVGRILVDGTDLRLFEVDYWRKHIGLVSQEPVLFNVSLYDNIALGRKDATAQDVLEAARLASALPFVQSLELGFHTEVGVKGRLLSGGQRQRIALARALVRSPTILILDEATSSLDNKCEAEVQQALDRLLAEKRFTAIVIAQRLSTVKNADKIIVLSNGKKVEEGTHESLLRNNGFYSELVNVQASSTVATAPAVQVLDINTTSYAARINEPAQRKPGTAAIIKLMQLSGNNKCWLLLGVLSAMLAGLNYPAYGYLMARQISYTVTRQGSDMVTHCQTLAAVVICIALGAFLFTTIMSISLGKVTANITAALRKSAFQSILYQEAAYHDHKEHSPQVLIHTLERDCEHVSAAGGPLLGSLMMLVCAIVTGSYVGISHSYKLGLLNTVLNPLLFIGLIRGYIMQAEGKPRPEVEAANSLLSDSIANIRTLHAYNITGDLQDRYQSQLRLAVRNSTLKLQMAGLTYGVSVALLYYLFAIAFWYGAKLVRDEGLDYESECIAIFSPFMGAMGVTIAVVFAPDLSAGSKAVKRLFALIEYQSSITATDPSGLKPKLEGHIEFRDVLFAYPHKATPVLQGVSFKVPAGTSLGITGSSGSGKSTIVQLLLRFYDATAGDILIDRVPIKFINLRYLRESIAVVSQEPVLFSGTIRENVSFGKENTSEESIISALIQAQALDFVQKHPSGLDRNVGIRGSGLSGGQKQRIAIARAIHRNPKILILDEATSALDNKTEQLLQHTLGNVANGRTCLIVAHRLCTIKSCDQIMVVEEGRIREAGRHDELMKREGSMYAAQMQHTEKRCNVN
jgi:ABC-type multidrug transport system fused ATPase/permease subunit